MMMDRRRVLMAATLSTLPLPAFAKGGARKPVVLTYIGNAGWRIDGNGVVILVDPFVSQFQKPRAFYAKSIDVDAPDEILIPDGAQIAAHASQADYIVATHSHQDHMLDAPVIAKRTGATIIGSESSANIARAYAVPEKQLIIVKGGEDYEFGRFSLRVIPSLHSPLLAKHYNNLPIAGVVPPGLKAPLHESAYQEGGTFAYLLRIAGHQILIRGGMNYIEREMQGLRPDIALVGSGGSHTENYDYCGRLMRALGDPAVVFPTHWDQYANKTAAQAHLEAEQFAAEIKAASPKTRVIIPEYFKPMTLN
jgi:L-ascorbate metabolism protein UlaG (beta-lactamase superfamily)